MSHMHSLADKYEGKLVHKLTGVTLYVSNEDISLFWGVIWQKKKSVILLQAVNNFVKAHLKQSYAKCLIK